MDGNGRWAVLRGLPRIAGHQEGIKSVRELISLSLELGIKVLTIYAFSQENWNRPAQEITALMRLLEHYLSTERSSLVEKGVRFQTIGRVTALPASALQWVRTTEQETAHLDKLILNVALITAAVRNSLMQPRILRRPSTQVGSRSIRSTKGSYNRRSIHTIFQTQTS